MNSENKLKQILVMRKDLKVRRGKEWAQISHASSSIIIQNLSELEQLRQMNLSTSPYASKYFSNNIKKLHEWCFNGKFTKVSVYVNSEQELLEIYNKAKDQGILCSLITDSGLTEFHGVPTITCCAIGPDYSEILDPITGHLKLA